MKYLNDLHDYLSLQTSFVKSNKLLKNMTYTPEIEVWSKTGGYLSH